MYINIALLKWVQKHTHACTHAYTHMHAHTHTHTHTHTHGWELFKLSISSFKTIYFGFYNSARSWTRLESVQTTNTQKLIVTNHHRLLDIYTENWCEHNLHKLRTEWNGPWKDRLPYSQELNQIKTLIPFPKPQRHTRLLLKIHVHRHKQWVMFPLTRTPLHYCRLTSLNWC